MLEMAEPSTGRERRDRQTGMTMQQPGVGFLAVVGGSTEPLGKEDLLHLTTVGQVAGEHRPEFPVTLDADVEQIDEPVDRRLTADAIEQIGSVKRPHPQRGLDQPAMPELLELPATQPVVVHAVTIGRTNDGVEGRREHRPRGSRDAELVALRVEHHDPFDQLAGELGPDDRRTHALEVGRLGEDQLLALGQLPRRFTGDPISMCIRFLAVFPSGTLRKPIAGPIPSGSTIDAPSGKS